MNPWYNRRFVSQKAIKAESVSLSKRRNDSDGVAVWFPVENILKLVSLKSVPMNT